MSPDESQKDTPDAVDNGRREAPSLSPRQPRQPQNATPNDEPEQDVDVSVAESVTAIHEPTERQVSQSEPDDTPLVGDTNSHIIQQNSTLTEWRAPEYIHHEKSIVWFIVLGVVAIAGSVVATIFSQWLFAVLIIVMGVTLGVLAKRPPREVHYQITSKGVDIGDRHFPFAQLKSFGILDEGDMYAVLLRPAKRFMPSVTVYFAHHDGERIFDSLAASLPMEELKPDLFDKLTRRLRF